MRACAGQVLVAAVLFAGTAFADPYDLRLYKLTDPDTDPNAHVYFRAFSRQLAAAMTSANLMPPETLGHAAFSINAELSVVMLDQTHIPMPTERYNAERRGIDGALLLPSIHVRKGLPWSFEVGTRVAWLEKSRMVVGTGEVKWALNEGFAYLPDLGVRGHVTRLFNTRDFDLTAGGVDIGIGKQFAVGGMVTLTPYAGWNLVWVASAAGQVDFNPGRPAGAIDASPSAPFEDTSRFKEVTLGANSHNRFYGGVRFIGGALQLGAEYSVSQFPRIPFEEPQGAQLELPPVRAVNVTLGLDF